MKKIKNWFFKPVPEVDELLVLIKRMWFLKFASH